MTSIILNRWASSGDEIPTGASGLETMELNIPNVSSIVHEVDDFISANKQGRIFTTRGFQLALLWQVTGCFAGESLGVKERTTLESYMSAAFERLDAHQDSGLLPPGACDDWSKMSDKDRKKAKEACMEASDLILDFPSLIDINVIAVLEHCFIPIGYDDIPATMPVVSETSSGIATIVPVFDTNDYISASMFGYMQENEDDLYVDNIHIWNIVDGKISKPVDNAMIKVEKSITEL